MVAFASLIGAAAIYAGVASAGPMMMASDSMMGSKPSSAYGSAATPPSQYGNGSGYGSKDNNPDKNMMSSSSSSSMAMAMTSAAPYAANTPPPSYGSGSGYGSGSSNWNNNGGYDNCVQQCVAQFGSPSSMSMPPSSTTPPSSNGSPPGNGVTHTVIVAPTQGVLRFVPFAVNASVGDTVMFMWGANNHTVTKSSQLELCNKTSDAPFASGEQNKPFTFTQVVNDTNPTFFYCGTPTHCEKGMFGIINPPNAYQQPSAASNMMPSLASQYPSTQAAWSYTSNMTANNTAASNWGMNMDMSKMPSWSQSYLAENIMYTQSFIAANPETVSPSGNIDLSLLSNNAVMLPTDVAAAARQNNAQSSTPSSSASSSTPSATPSTAAASGGLKSGASALASPRVAVAFVAVAAAFFAL
jgi:plastocyanin